MPASENPSKRPARRGPAARPGAKGGKRALNRAEKTMTLADAALSLFVARGVGPVTIEEIAKEAGVAKGSFYRYFDSKADVVDALLAPLAGDVRTAMRRCGIALAKANDADALQGAYSKLAAELVAATLPRRDLVRLYLHEKRVPGDDVDTAMLRQLSLELDDAAMALSETARAKGLIAVEDPRVSALMVVGAVEHLGLRVLSGLGDPDPLTISRVMVSVVLDGLRAR